MIDIMWYPPENTNIDQGGSQYHYWYSVVHINIYSMTQHYVNIKLCGFLFFINFIDEFHMPIIIFV